MWARMSVRILRAFIIKHGGSRDISIFRDELGFRDVFGSRDVLGSRDVYGMC
jgi:hypothetical protein